MATPAAVLSKTCSKCGEGKSVDEFPPRKTSRDGLHGWCRPCFRGYHQVANRRWRAQNRERHRQNQRRQYAANAEWRREQAQQYRDRDREKITTRERERQRKRYQTNPVFRAYRLAYAARRRALTGLAVPAEWVARLYEMPCSYCGATEAIEIDHIVPLSRGGEHVKENMAPACRRCNRSKKDKLLSEWGGP